MGRRGGSNWRERRLAWFLERLQWCWETIPDARTGERGVRRWEWQEATGLDEDEFQRLYDEAWGDNLIGYSISSREEWGTPIEGEPTYWITDDGHRFLGFLAVEGSRYRKQPIPPDLRWAVWERDNFTCRHCGSRRDLAVDHIAPESRGGAMALDNLQTLCKSCNSRKGAR